MKNVLFKRNLYLKYNLDSNGALLKVLSFVRTLFVTKNRNKLVSMVGIFFITALIFTTLDVFAQDDDSVLEESITMQGIEQDIDFTKIETDPQAYFDQIRDAFTTNNQSFHDLLAFSAGMVVYGLFVWHFYQMMSRREMFKTGFQKYFSSGFIGKRFIGWLIKNLIIFPLAVFLWFIVYSTFMFFLAQGLPSQTVLLVVGSLVVATRISAYYKEDLAKDLSKLLPFAMLGIFLTQPTFFKIDEVTNRISEIPSFIGDLVVFIIFIILVEGVLSILFIIKRGIFKSTEEQKLEEKIEEQVDAKMTEKIEEIEEKFDKKQKKTEEKLDKKIKNNKEI